MGEPAGSLEYARDDKPQKEHVVHHDEKVSVPLLANDEDNDVENDGNKQ